MVAMVKHFLRKGLSFTLTTASVAVLSSVILVSAASHDKNKVPAVSNPIKTEASRAVDNSLTGAVLTTPTATETVKEDPVVITWKLADPPAPVPPSPTMSLFFGEYAGDIWDTGVIYCMQRNRPIMFVSSFDKEGWAYFFSDFSICDGGMYFNVGRGDPASIEGLTFNGQPEVLAWLVPTEGGYVDPQLRLQVYSGAGVPWEPITQRRSEGGIFTMCDAPVWDEWLGMPYTLPDPAGGTLDQCTDRIL